MYCRQVLDPMAQNTVRVCKNKGVIRNGVGEGENVLYCRQFQREHVDVTMCAQASDAEHLLAAQAGDAEHLLAFSSGSRLALGAAVL